MKSQPISKKEHIICLLAIAVLLGITAIFLFKDQELGSIARALSSVKLPYILLGVLAIAVFFAFEARATQILSQPLIGKKRFFTFYRYSLIDFYFSSITPGCSGGQPSQLYYMHRDKIPLSASSLAVLTFNMTYHLAVLVVAGVAIAISSLDLFAQIGAFKYLLFFGVAAQVFLVVIYMLAIFHQRLANNLVNFAIKILVKLRIIKNRDQAIDKAAAQLAEYRRGALYMKENPLLLLRTAFLSLLHILALYSIPFWVFKAFGLSGYSFLELVAIQAALTLSVESLPIPGGIGVTESGFMLIYGSVFGQDLLVSALLLTRGLNYYLGLVAGGIVSAVSLRKGAVHIARPQLTQKAVKAKNYVSQRP